MVTAQMERQRLGLGADLKRELPDCSELWVAVALVSEDGFRFVQASIDPTVPQQWVLGVDLATAPRVLRRFMAPQEGPIKGRYYHRKRKTFHPKVYLLRMDQKYVAYVGSGNCTLGGLETNTELALRTEDQQLCESLRKTIESWYKLGSDVDEDFLAAYELLYAKRMARRTEDAADAETLLPNEETPAIDLSKIDFTGQFFSRAHFEAFTPPKPRLRTPLVNAERVEVRNHLYKLNDRWLLQRIKQRGWDLHEHYRRDDIVSSAVHGQYTSDWLDGIWLHYGRDKSSIKDYGEDETPLNFMRLQVVVLATCVGIWLRISKDHGSEHDRRHIRERLNDDPAWTQRLFSLVSALPTHYYIRLNNQSRQVNEFTTADALKQYLLEADPKYYFMVGMDIPAGDARLLNTNIADTVMHEFGLLYPVYEMMLHRLGVTK
jgi:HKD family nuclease